MLYREAGARASGPATRQCWAGPLCLEWPRRHVLPFPPRREGLSGIPDPPRIRPARLCAQIALCWLQGQCSWLVTGRVCAARRKGQRTVREKGATGQAAQVSLPFFLILTIPSLGFLLREVS